MLLIIFIFFFVKIEFVLCIFENKDERALVTEINHERVNLGLKPVQMHLILQLAAEKRCSNRAELLKSYEKMLSNTYRTTDWPREEHLNEYLPLGNKNIL